MPNAADPRYQAGLEAIARRHFERANPQVRAGDWDWLPPAARRQWIEEAREDLDAALEAMGPSA